MTHRKRLHPERVVLCLGLPLMIATWTLGLIGFIAGNRQAMMWAGYALVATLVVASTPIVVFVIGVTIEKRRSDRHD